MSLHFFCVITLFLNDTKMKKKSILYLVKLVLKHLLFLNQCQRECICTCRAYRTPSHKLALHCILDFSSILGFLNYLGIEGTSL